MEPITDKEILAKSLAGVQRWVEAHDYRGYEPFDGLSSFLRPLAMGTLLGERILQQFVRQCPVNIRPLVGIRPQESTKGRGYMAWGYLYQYRATGDQSNLRKAESCLSWLEEHRAPDFRHHAWSNHFDFASRAGSYTKRDPIIVWTALVGQAFLEAYEITRAERWLDVADSACRWITALPREKTRRGHCISYLALAQSSIHNSNMLGGALLARTAKHVGNSSYLEIAHSAMEYSCSRQLPSGAWWYGEDPKYRWVDSFHTGYNLDSLRCYLECGGDQKWESSLRAGLEYYKRHFFEDTGRPRYYDDRRYPIDIQCAAQSIDSFARFSDDDPDCLSLSKRVALWTIRNMQSRDGHFYYRAYPLLKARTPMLHWAQATTFKAIAHLLYKLSLLPLASGPEPQLPAHSCER
jgi:hypothetical protein